MAEILKTCRLCGREVSSEARTCPGCGALDPAFARPRGYGFEYKSKAGLFGIPLLHISFKYTHKRKPVVARGIIAIGQFACGFISIGQISLGVLSLGQLSIAWLALAQIAFANRLIAQIGLYISSGHGQLVFKLSELSAKLFGQ